MHSQSDMKEYLAAYRAVVLLTKYLIVILSAFASTATGDQTLDSLWTTMSLISAFVVTLIGDELKERVDAKELTPDPHESTTRTPEPAPRKVWSRSSFARYLFLLAVFRLLILVGTIVSNPAPSAATVAAPGAFDPGTFTPGVAYKMLVVIAVVGGLSVACWLANLFAIWWQWQRGEKSMSYDVTAGELLAVNIVSLVCDGLLIACLAVDDTVSRSYAFHPTNTTNGDADGVDFNNTGAALFFILWGSGIGWFLEAVMVAVLFGAAHASCRSNSNNTSTPLVGETSPNGSGTGSGSPMIRDHVSPTS